MLTWLENPSVELSSKARSNFYVAVTRAKYSVAIVCNENITLNGAEIYKPC